jgi:hypothetical protein
VESFEEKIYAAPVKALALRCSETGDWSCKALSDTTGAIQFGLEPSLRSDPVTFAPHTVLFEGRRFDAVACCICPYGTLVAFSVSRSEEAPGASSRRLVNKTSPENSAIAVVADGQVYFAFDGTIDGPLVKGTATIRIVAFEPFSTPVDSFEVAFIPKATRDQADPDAITIQISGESISRSIASMWTIPSLVEQFERLVSQEVGREAVKIRRSLPNNRPRKSGWFFLMIAAVGGIAAGLAGFH